MLFWCLHSLHRGSKLNMLLRESLGHANCHTAVIAEVADSMVHLQETFSTIQLASHIRRTQKRTKVRLLFLKLGARSLREQISQVLFQECFFFLLRCLAAAVLLLNIYILDQTEHLQISGTCTRVNIKASAHPCCWCSIFDSVISWNLNFPQNNHCHILY